MNKLKLLMTGIIIFCVFTTISVSAALTPKIAGESVYRTNATTATIRFLSNTEGIAYYKITSNRTAPADIVSEETSFSVNANTTASISLTDLSSGSKYIHIVVKDRENILSNVLTIAMPYDIYYFDNFESYVDSEGVPTERDGLTDSKPQLFIKNGAPGTGIGNQKIIIDSTNKVLNTSGGNTGLEIRTNLPSSITSGYIVYQAKVKNTGSHDYLQYGTLTLGADDELTRHVLAGINSTTFGYYNVSSWNTTSKTAESDITYNEKIVLNVATKQYDFYVDNVKINARSINAKNYDSSIKWFGLYNGGGVSYYDDIKMYVTDEYYHNIIKGSETNGTFEIDKSAASDGETVNILNILPDQNYKIKEIKILKSTDNSDVTSNVDYNKDNQTFIMPNYDVKVNVEFELISYSLIINEVKGATISPNGTITIPHGGNKDIIITANNGYRLTSVKVNGIEFFPLTNNKILLTNIIENKQVVVKVEKIEYIVLEGDGQKHEIGKKEDAVFRINANKSLFNKVYINNKELDSKNYTVTEGSTIITLKQSFLETLVSGTYNLKATFSDGGEASATFVIEENKEDNPKTIDSIMTPIVLGCISLFGLTGI